MLPALSLARSPAPSLFWDARTSGKSTLLNQIVGQKAGDRQPQSPRPRAIGSWASGTGRRGRSSLSTPPGFTRLAALCIGSWSKRRWAWSAGVEAALLVVEPPESAAAVKIGAAERQILEVLRQSGKPVVLAINKVDTVKDKPSLFPILKAWQEIAPFAALGACVGAQRIRGPGPGRRAVQAASPGPPLYAADMLTDRTERFLAGELIREQLFLALRQELPYATAVVIENWEERPDRKDVVIDAVIVVERESQKIIVVGKGGR